MMNPCIVQHQDTAWGQEGQQIVLKELLKGIALERAAFMG